MTYFSKFPQITYDFTVKSDPSKITETFTDLTTKVMMFISDQDLENLCFHYTIKGSELPENISQTYYSTPELAWTITYINKIGNLSTDWPLSDIELLNYVSNKYGISNIYSIHHYVKTPENVVMDQSYIISQYGSQYALPVTNLDYETSINEYKRMIYLIKPEYITSFVNNYFNQLV